MSREKIESVTCDRCRELVRYRPGNPPREPWASVFAADANGREIVGTHETAADLCPRCTSDLADFMRGETVPALPLPE